MTIQVLLKHFDRLAEAPSGIPNLRDMILQLATRGTLTPQDRGDEPASRLLHRIDSANARLRGAERPVFAAAAGSEGRSSPATPKGWERQPLGRLVVLNYGKGVVKSEQREGPVPVYGANGILRYHDKALVDSPCIVVGRKGSAGALNRVYTPCWPSDVTYYVTPPEGIDFEYCYLMLRASHLEELAKGIKPGLSRNEAYNVRALLPPLAEQKRIVAKVGELMALCDDLEAKQQKKRVVRITLNRACLRAVAQPNGKGLATAWHRVRDHFDDLYCIPETVAELRQTILQLAVMGRLVPQDPSDEPATGLLKKIRAEKERLIAAGVIRKTKPMPAIETGEPPFRLPKGWEWVRVGSVGQTQTGTTPKKSNPAFFGKGYPFVKPADVSLSGEIQFDGEELTEDGIRNGRRIAAGSALMVCIGGSIGKVGFADRECSCNQQINAVTPCGGIGGRFVAYVMRSTLIQEQVLSNAPTTTLPILSKSKWEKLLLPLPPLAEQERIVARVDQLMAQCDALESGLQRTEANAEALFASVVRELVTAEQGAAR